MEAWGIICYIMAILVIAIPLFLCYKVFNKCEKGSCSNGCAIFCAIYASPCFGGSIGVVFQTLTVFMIIIWIFSVLSGIGIGLLNYRFLKLKAKITHDDYSFNHAAGIISLYAFLYFVLIGSLIMFIEDEEEDSLDFFELKYRQRAWIYFLVECVQFSGLFLSTMGEYYVLKHDLSKYILIYFMVGQMLPFPFNLSYLLEFKTGYIVIIIIFGIANSALGTYLWMKYKSDTGPIIVENKTNELVTATSNS